MKISLFKGNDFVGFILPGFFFGSWRKFVRWIVLIVRVKTSVHGLIVLATAVDSISGMVLVRNMNIFGGDFILYFSYLFVSHFFCDTTLECVHFFDSSYKSGQFFVSLFGWEQLVGKTLR